MELTLAEGVFVGACALLIVLLMFMYCGISCPPEGTPPSKPVAELPEVVQKLWFGKALYSRSFLLDCWMNLRNKHILFSCFLAHPLHPPRPLGWERGVTQRPPLPPPSPTRLPLPTLRVRPAPPPCA